MADAPRGLGLPPLPERPRVTVVLPVRNEAAFLPESLGAVLHQTRRPDQVIVVDGDSDDDTADLARAMLAGVDGLEYAVLVNEQRIPPISLNRALAKAHGDVIIRVDGHCIVDADYVEACLTALRESGAECVGGPIRTVGVGSYATAIAVAQSSRFGVGGVAFRTSTEPRFVDTVAFPAYRREVFDLLGEFDGSLVRNEDDEYNMRLTQAGGRIWMDPRVGSTYFSRSSLRRLARQYFEYGYYKVALIRKHRAVPALRQLVPAAFVASLVGALLLARRRRWPLGLLAGTYLTATCTSAAGAARAGPRASVPLVAAAIVTMHLAYGLGFWRAALPWPLKGATR